MHRLVPKTHGLVQARSQKWYKLVQVARPDADFWCKMHTVHCKSSSCTFLVHELLLHWCSSEEHHQQYILLSKS